MFLLDTVNTGCIMGMVYEPLVLNYGKFYIRPLAISFKF